MSMFETWGSLRSDDATLKGSWCTSGQDTNSSEYPTLLSFGDSPRNTFANSGCDQMDTIPDMTSTTSAFLKRVQLRKHVRGAKANRRPQDEADKAKHLAKKQVPKGDRTKDRTRVGQLDFCFGSEADSVEDTLRWLQSSAHHFWGEAVVLEICLTPKYAGRDVQEPIWISLQNMQPFYPQPSTVEVALEILSNSTGHCAKWQFYERNADVKVACYLPMDCYGQCIGVLRLSAKDTLSLDESGRDMFQPLVSIAVLRLMRAELHQSFRRQSTELTRTSRILESVFPRHVLHELCHRSENFSEQEDAGCDVSRSWTLGSDSTQDSAFCRQQTVSDCSESSHQPLYAESHDHVATIFADIKDFTPISEACGPAGVMRMLNQLFKKFDDIMEAFHPMSYKVETVGDSYVVACGLLPDCDTDPSIIAMHSIHISALMLRAAREVLVNEEPVQLRVGIHMGPLMSGIVGKRVPRFCLFGDTVNTASRMESTGIPGKIHVSEQTKEFCGNAAACMFYPLGDRQIKGKGKMRTYWLDPDEVLRPRPLWPILGKYTWTGLALRH
ncbi:unnamed protein product [Effrenium voratum]|nr:unnamed protein product [Effrenium voratum]